MIVLADRIKEISHDSGIGNLKLDYAAIGFSAFGDFYTSGDAVFYAITNGVDYEIGSGQYIETLSDHSISRFPFDSSNSDALVSWGGDVKEVFVTYPGKYAVFTASGMSDFQEPKPSGLAFWGSSQILCYDDNLTWSPTRDTLGISNSDPRYALDVGGAESYSIIRSSGIIIGDSGVMFSGVSATPGRQIEPFLRSKLDNTTGTDAVFSLDGLVGEELLFQKQDQGTIFAGPPSGCSTADCTPGYPTFRHLVSGDIPDLSVKYTRQYNDGVVGNVAFYKSSGVYQHDPYFTWDNYNNRLGLSENSPAYTLDVDGDGRFTGNLIVEGTLDAHVSDFKVTADTMTFGDASSDTVIFNAASVSVPNSLIFNGGNVGISETLIASGNTILGDASSDTVTFNADTVSIPNNLHFDGGNVQLHENLGVSGTLNASGDVQVYKNLIVVGNTDVSGTLGISGNAIFEGNVGIGTSSPLQLLSILGTSAQLRIATPTTATDPSLFLSGGTDTAEGLKLWYDYSSGASYIDNLINDAAGDLYIRTKTAGTPVNAIVIESAGNVGIGTTNPEEKFHVAGNAVFKNNVGVSGTFDASGYATFGGDTTFNNNITVGGNAVASGTMGVSGLVTLNGGLDTGSAHTVINSSGYMIAPGYTNEAAVMTALPASTPHSGVLAVGGTSLMWCNGTSWLSGVLA